MKKSNYLIIGCLVVISIIACIITANDYFSNYTIAGVEDQFRARGIQVVEGWDKFPGGYLYETNYVIPYFQDAINYYPTAYNLTTVYVLPHYSDSHPFYSLLFYKDGFIWEHIYTPEKGPCR